MSYPILLRLAFLHFLLASTSLASGESFQLRLSTPSKTYANDQSLYTEIEAGQTLWINCTVPSHQHKIIWNVYDQENRKQSFTHEDVLWQHLNKSHRQRFLLRHVGKNTDALGIVNATEADSGWYACGARTILIERAVYVFVSKGPVFFSANATQQNASSTLLIPCRTSRMIASTEVSLGQYDFNDKKFIYGRLSASFDSRVGFTVLREDLGQDKSTEQRFQCRYSRGKRTEYSEIFNVKLLPLEDFQVGLQIEPKKPYIGAMLKLTCEIHVYKTVPQVSYFGLECSSCETKKLSNLQTKWNAKRNRLTISAIIPKLSASNNGDYECFFGNATVKKIVKVAENMSIIDHLDERVEKDEGTTMHCAFSITLNDALRNGIVRWKHIWTEIGDNLRRIEKGEFLKDSEKHRIVSLAMYGSSEIYPNANLHEFHHVLRIEPLKTRDSGRYVAILHTREGDTDLWGCEVKVLTKDDDDAPTVRISNEFPVKPFLEHFYIETSATVEVGCITSRDKQVTLSWKDSKDCKNACSNQESNEVRKGTFEQVRVWKRPVEVATEFFCEYTQSSVEPEGEEKEESEPQKLWIASPKFTVSLRNLTKGSKSSSNPIEDLVFECFYLPLKNIAVRFMLHGRGSRPIKGTNFRKKGVSMHIVDGAKGQEILTGTPSCVLVHDGKNVTLPLSPTKVPFRIPRPGIHIIVPTSTSNNNLEVFNLINYKIIKIARVALPVVIIVTIILLVLLVGIALTLRKKSSRKESPNSNGTRKNHGKVAHEMQPLSLPRDGEFDLLRFPKEDASLHAEEPLPERDEVGDVETHFDKTSMGTEEDTTFEDAQSIATNNNASALQSDYTYYQFKEFEITWGRQIGKGFYGKVHEAHWRNRETGAVTKVAIKQCNDSAGTLEEAQALRRIPTHPNILMFHGLHEDLEHGFGIVVEYCENGDLKKFLNHVDASKEFQRNSGDMSDVSSSCIITTSDLLSFSFQTALGMQHLHANNCIHRDLAARNILVTKTLVIKIADFGLSRKLESDGYYSQATDRPLPKRYLTQCAITDGKFSKKNDVWAYGFTLWEIFSLGKTVPRFTSDEIRNGKRWEQPTECGAEIYELMAQCWKLSSKERPDFDYIVQFFESYMKRSPSPTMEMLINQQ